MSFTKYENRFYVAGTGHRPQSLPGGFDSYEENMESMRGTMRKCIEDAQEKHDDVAIISGMALGFDTALAQIAIEKELPLICAIPFKGQELKWTKDSIKVYNDILKKACHKEYIANYYKPWFMQVRNEWMVDNCDLLLACWNRDKKGGTYNCLKYAFKHDVKVKNLYSDCFS
jgi:uncharacterized phage-like protein YoqJ